MLGNTCHHPGNTSPQLAPWHAFRFEMSFLRQLSSRGVRIAAQLQSATLCATRLDDPSRSQANAAAAHDSTWKHLEEKGYDVNPCGSWHHPAVKAGLRPADNQKSLQEAYTPASSCFGCGMTTIAFISLCNRLPSSGMQRRHALVFCVSKREHSRACEHSCSTRTLSDGHCIQ